MEIDVYDAVTWMSITVLSEQSIANGMALCPSLSRSAVEKALRDLIATGFISKHGSDPATFYLLEE